MPPPVIIEKPAPPPKVVFVEKPVVIEKPVVVEKRVIIEKEKVFKVPVPRAPSPCRGLTESPCGNLASCHWIKHKKPTDKNGRVLVDYCRLKPGSLGSET